MHHRRNERRLPHAWVVYVAALAPAAAVAFAFSLGPSPHKQLARLRVLPAAEAAKVLDRLGPGALPAVLEELERPDPSHRPLLVERLSAARYRPAAEALGLISRDPTVPASERAAALNALERIDAASAAGVARSLLGTSGRLGSEASRILTTPDRS